MVFVPRNIASRFAGASMGNWLVGHFTIFGIPGQNWMLVVLAIYPRLDCYFVALTTFLGLLLCVISVAMSEDDADRFRKQAEECRQQAERAISPLSRRLFLVVAARPTCMGKLSRWGIVNKQSGRNLLLTFSSIQNPRPVSECYVNSPLPKSSAKLNRQLVQHRFDCFVRQVA
jgi:hypothetical protein